MLLTREWYMHPNGQLPAYEWAFGDVNPPVHAWAAWRVYQIDRKQRGGAATSPSSSASSTSCCSTSPGGSTARTPQGRNIFEGGFLGLDNIGVFDRSAPLPTGGYIEQADGTAWMAMYCLNLLRIALELALHNPVYEDIATKFFEHFLYIADAMNNIGGARRHRPLGRGGRVLLRRAAPARRPTRCRCKVRSMVGLIPLFAVETLEPELLEQAAGLRRAAASGSSSTGRTWPQLVSRWHEPGRGERRLLSLLRGHRMKALLRRMLDETEFLSDYGVRVAVAAITATTPTRSSAAGSS